MVRSEGIQGKRLSLESEDYLLSVLLALTIIFCILHGTSLELKDFTNRAIGISVVAGIDAPYRGLLYFVAIGASIVLIIGNLLIFGTVNTHLRKKPLYALDNELRALLFDVSLFALMMFSLFLLTGEDLFFNIMCLFFVYLIILYCYVVVRAIARTCDATFIDTWSPDRQVLVYGLLFPYPLFFIHWTLTDSTFTVSSWHLIAYPFLVCVFFLVYAALIEALRALSIKRARLDDALALSSILYVLIPISVPLMNELQYTLSSRSTVPPQTLALLTCGLLVLTSVLLFLVSLLRPFTRPTCYRIVEWYYLPLIIATVTLYAWHEHVLSYVCYDLHHLGQEMLASHQLYNFGSVPYIDILPTHGMTEAVPKIVYSLVNGYRLVEPMLWNWLLMIPAMLIIYAFLSVVAGPTFAFISVLTLPMIRGTYGTFGLMHGSYYYESLLFTLLPILLLPRLLRGGRFPHLVLFWSYQFLLFFWRMDLCFASLGASTLIWAFVFLSRWHRADPQDHVPAREVVYSFLLAFVSTASLYMAIVLVTSDVPLSTLLERYRDFLSVGGRALTAESLFDTRTHQISRILFQYLLIPSVSVVYICYAIIKGFFQRAPLTTRQLTLLHLSIYTMALFVRSVIRYSLFRVGYCTFFSYFLAMCILFYFEIRRTDLAKAFFVLLALLYIAAFPRIDILLDDDLFSFHEWVPGMTRLRDNDVQYGRIVEFFDHHLGPEQTFFDFTNLPLLYVMADRRVVTSIPVNLAQTSERIQTSVLEELEAANSVELIPFVVFKQNGASCNMKGMDWDRADGVSNEVRSYRVAEFIYRNYHPLGRVGSYELWIDNDEAFQARAPAEVVLPITRKTIGPDTATDADGPISCPYNGGPCLRMWDFLDLSGLATSELGRKRGTSSTLNLTYVSSKKSSGLIRFDCRYPSHVVGLFEPFPIKDQERTEVSIPLPEDCMVGELENITLDVPTDATFEVMDARIVERRSFSQADSVVTQHFELRELPRIWASFDEKDATHRTDVIATPYDGPEELIVDWQDITLPVDPNIDKRSGNYLHIRARANDAATIFVRYGTMGSTFSFNVRQSEEFNDYLIRLSTQWSWMTEDIDAFHVTASYPVRIESVYVRGGD